MSERDQLEVEALVTDRYLESLLAARDRRDQPPRRGAAPGVDRDLDAGVAATARSLELGLIRVHPSFRFEERLAADLQVAASRQRRLGRPARLSSIRRLEPRSAAARTAAAGAAPGNDLLDATTIGHGFVTRPLLIGGALTSAALSIAGAYVAWRRGRPPLDPMVRAVRAAHRSGLGRRLPSRAARLSFPPGARNH